MIFEVVMKWMLRKSFQGQCNSDLREAFGRSNGADSLADMRRRIERLRREPSDARGSGDYPIGCLMLSSPVFFDRADWITSPSDWSPNIVQEKSYNLLEGEGARIWSRCQALASFVFTSVAVWPSCGKHKITP